MLGEEGAELDQPFGDPGSLVQQGARGEERAERGVDRGRRSRSSPSLTSGARRPSRRRRRTPARRRRGARSGWSRRRSGGPRRRHGSRSSRPTMTSKTADDVVDVPGHQADAVQRPAGRHQPDRADQPARGLEADDAVEGGGYATGSRGVGGDGERHLAERDGQRGAGAGAAGDQLAAVDAPRDRVGGAGAVQAGGELVEVGLADVAGHPPRSAVAPPAPSRRPRTRSRGTPASSAQPAMSMLSLTPNGIPNSGSVLAPGRFSIPAAAASSSRAGPSTATCRRHRGRDGVGDSGRRSSSAIRCRPRVSQDLGYRRPIDGPCASTAMIVDCRQMMANRYVPCVDRVIDATRGPDSACGRGLERGDDRAGSLVSAPSGSPGAADAVIGPVMAGLLAQVRRHRQLQLEQDRLERDVQLTVVGELDHGGVERAVRVVASEFIGGSRIRSSASRTGSSAASGSANGSAVSMA